MSSELRKKKLAHLFKIYDTDKNGILAEDDFILLTRRLAKVKGIEEGSRQYQQVYDHTIYWWRLLEIDADINGDGDVDLPEFIHFWETAAESHETVEELEQTFAEIFDMLDSDSDGQVTVREYAQYLKANRVETDPKACFKKLDTDGDGQMNKRDIVKAAGEFFFSDDPKAPGNFFYGALS